jgi:hypothetical protein
VDPQTVVRGGEEEYCQAVVPGQTVFARASREELQNELTLVRENSKPVGSGRFRDHAQDSRGVLGMFFSSSLALRERGCVAYTHGGA